VDIADPIYLSFEIPQTFLTGIFAQPRSVWTRLHQRQIGISLASKNHETLQEFLSINSRGGWVVRTDSPHRPVFPMENQFELIQGESPMTDEKQHELDVKKVRQCNS
jgi:hypothetical protein